VWPHPAAHPPRPWSRRRPGLAVPAPAAPLPGAMPGATAPVDLIRDVTGPRGVVLVGPCASLGPGIALVGGDRYRCRSGIATDAAGGEIVVLPPCPPEEIAALQAGHPGAVIMVVDRRDSTRPALAAACLSAGADAFVRGGQAALVVAYLDSLARRRPVPPLGGAA
jgi:hypothetical protein